LPIAFSTGRAYENTLRQFMHYVTDARYGWPQQCLDRFGRAPQQILHEWNSVRHVTEYEGDPQRRPLTYDEVQALFDAADSLAERIRVSGRKGALAAQRDAVVLKTIYAFGLRRHSANIRRGSSPWAMGYRAGWAFVPAPDRRSVPDGQR
jgi:integrase